MSNFDKRLAALPEWPTDHLLDLRDDDTTQKWWYANRLQCALARLALAREWIELHGPRWTAGHKDTGRDALLAKMEVPK